MTAGSLTSARATARRCFSPPESCSGRKRSLVQTDPVEHGFGALARLGADGAGEVGGDFDVLQNVQRTKEVEVLEDEPELPSPNRRPAALGDRPKIRVANGDAPGGG